jgi:hypothetical protein
VVEISTDYPSSKRVQKTEIEFCVTNQALLKKTDITWVTRKEKQEDILIKPLTRKPFEHLRQHLLGS